MAAKNVLAHRFMKITLNVAFTLLCNQSPKSIGNSMLLAV